MYRFLINLLEIQTDTKSIKMHCVGVCVYVGGRGGGGQNSGFASLYYRLLIMNKVKQRKNITHSQYH